MNGDTPLTPEERRLVLRAVTVIAAPLALITLAALLVGGIIVYHELRARTRENADAIQAAETAARQAATLSLRLDEQRAATDRALAQRVYDECVENENQDAANVALFRKVRALVQQGPRTQARDELIEALRETEDAREPPGETDCPPPRSVP